MGGGVRLSTDVAYIHTLAAGIGMIPPKFLWLHYDRLDDTGTVEMGSTLLLFSRSDKRGTRHTPLHYRSTSTLLFLR